jgi:hypothetical protein
MALVSQVSKITSHRIAINSGFQINYGLPFRLKDFYSPIYWARAFSNVTNPIEIFFAKLGESDDGEENEIKTDDQEEETSTIVDDDDVETTTMTEISTTEKSKRKRKPKMKKRDLTAAEFYSGIKDTMSL